MEKLKGAMEDPRATRIQSWVEQLSADPNKAKAIHNYTIDFLQKYHLKNKKPKDSDEFYTYAIQVANFVNNEGESGFPPFSKDIYTTTTRIDMGADKKILKEQIMEYSKDILIASLFSTNRLDLGDRLSKTMELDQIKAVIKCVVDNNHIQMGTGQGKSSTVIPIVSIINALTSEEKGSLVVSINKNLVAELENKTRELVKKANHNGLRLPVFTDNKSREESAVGEEEKIKMMTEALSSSKNSEYSQKLLDRLYATYWGEELDYLARQKSDSFGQSKITFMSKDDFVFKIVNEGRSFVKSCPKVFFDEVDAPYVTGETYQSTHEDMYMSPENIRTMTTNYILDRLVLSKLDPQEDFRVYKGKGTVADGVQEKLMKVDWKGWVNGTRGDKVLDEALEVSLSAVCKFLNFDGIQRTGLKELILNNLKEHIFIGNQTIGAIDEEASLIYTNIIGATDNLADASYSLNKLYINEGANIVVRSSYFDQLLENHKFEPDAHIAMLALANKFNIVNLNSKASESAKFPTIISLLGDKLVGFSGTLKQRDLRTGKSQSSPLAKLLKEFTGKDVFEVRSPETKKSPSPLISEDIEGMKILLIEFLQKNKSEQPILLLSHYDTKTTQDIFTQLGQLYPNLSEIDILPSIPSDPKKLAQYYDSLKEKTKSLADGRIKILVSTGSIGIGADITMTDNTFPDIKIGILGLPENESQVKQNLGRRRKEGNDFFWIVDKESLRERATWLDDQRTMIVKAHLTEAKAIEQIDKLPLADDKRNLDFVLRLIHEAHLTTLTNEDFTVSYDRMFEMGFIPQAKRILTERIKKDYFRSDIDWEKDEKANKKLAELVKIFGLPDSLYNDLVRSDNTLGIQSNNTAEFMSKLNVVVSGKHNIIEREVDLWFETTKEDVDYIYHHFYKDGQENINQILLTGSPKDATFESVNNIPIHNLARESKQVEVGYATLPTSKFPKSVPAVKIFREDKVFIYLIENINIGQIRQIKEMFTYVKGGKSYLFTSTSI